ncbi:BTAD domain-containing putative transcriptional regulator [Streptantibioticus rubrisoli]|uniref:NB-ARC domain-containing protein n=1 Tax=Streptantibioticus rubrisoli TaxID=1387313 RepID=A0ABT1PA55_9ACTN|nr:BTAD domain-containing putative transcriptional regulator [Streptantibioticus rubrisoli]MCQ4042251.1 NB-ARC domain-containing protein [Streptantibioticus rubrisoli]
MTTEAVNFGLLGPLDIRCAARQIPLGAGRQRSVLALLLLQTNQEVTVESLIKRLWDGEPPGGARNAVQAYVARLRRTLREATGTDQLIRSGPGGYALTAPDDTVDLTRFRSLTATAERALARGELALAARNFTESLSLWRGAALQDVPCETLQRDEAPALEDERLHVVERLCDLDLMQGAAANALSVLRGVVAERPLRERPWCQLITALYQCGRRAEALTTYHDIAQLLYAELGVEPGPDLRAVHQCLLDDVEIEWPPPRDRIPQVRPAAQAPWAEPRQLPCGPAELAGREAAEEQAVRLLSTPTAAGTVPVVVLSGAPGCGKTALAVRVAHRLAARFPDGQVFLPLAAPDGTPRDPDDLLADALHATGLPAGEDQGCVPPGAMARSSLLRARLAGRRVLLVLDGASDPAQVTPLLPGEPGCAVLVTARTELCELTAFHGAHRMPLDCLEPDAALELLGQIVGRDRVAAEQEAAAELAAECGHLPLALCAAAANLASHRFASFRAYANRLRTGDRLALLSLGGGIGGSADGGGCAVRTAFGHSYRALPAPARRLFRLLGAADLPETGAEAAAALADLPVEEATGHAQRLAAAHLVTRTTHGRLRLPGLLRDYAVERARAEDDPAQLRAARARLLCWYASRTAAAVRACLPVPRSAAALFTSAQQAGEWLESEAANLSALARWPQGQAAEGCTEWAWHRSPGAGSDGAA